MAITLRRAISVLVCERLSTDTMAEAFEGLKAGHVRRQNHGRTMTELGHDLAAYIDPHVSVYCLFVWAQGAPMECGKGTDRLVFMIL